MKLIITKAMFRLIFIILSICWMEALLKYYCFGIVLGAEFIYTLLFSLPIACLLTLLSSLFNNQRNKVIFAILLFLHCCWYITQAVYYAIFKSFLLLDKINMIKDAFSSYGVIAVDAFFSALPIALLMLAPTIIIITLFVKDRKNRLAALFKPLSPKLLIFYILFFILTQTTAVFATYISDGGILSPKSVYTDSWTPELSMRTFGNLTTLRLNLKQIFIPSDTEVSANIVVVERNEPDSDKDALEAATPDIDIDEPVIYEANTLPIDFTQLITDENDSEINDLHAYFSQKEATLQNEYTGIFAGKNLIFITAEGFWQYAVNKEYTPTLYMLANQGFVFENFYNPLWWSSTTDGEFVATNGLHPLNYTRAFYETHDNFMPFTMGNMLLAEDYNTTAYHNHSYDYYDRHLTHPNMGYDYYGLGNGLDVTPYWPESDLEMMELTIPDAIESDETFHNYYMTVSGHLYYTFDGNAMSSKNMQAVESLNMSEEAKAYLACQIELDKALEYILEELEKAGELENTVICISSDHYPYGLSEEALIEFHGELPDEFELHRSPLIIWSGDMEEPIHIDKVCSSVDILPTLLNLFGLEYDSRLLSGKDILSNSPGIVLFSNQSFITDEGRYSTIVDKWIPNSNSTATESYASDIFNYLQLLIDANETIIMSDYYSSIPTLASTPLEQ